MVIRKAGVTQGEPDAISLHVRACEAHADKALAECGWAELHLEDVPETHRESVGDAIVDMYRKAGWTVCRMQAFDMCRGPSAVYIDIR